MSRLDWRQAITPAVYIVLLSVAMVFVHTGIEGEKGLRALREAEALKRELRAELAAAHAERAEMQNKVRRLSDGHLDLDLLDERTRAVLGHARPDEVILRP